MESAKLLEIKTLLANMSAGDMGAQEVTYHSKCLTGPYKRDRSRERSTPSAVSNEDMTNICLILYLFPIQKVLVPILRLLL